MDELRAAGHPFYRLPPWIQWPVAGLLFGAALAPWVVVFIWPVTLVAFPLIVSWHLFWATPMMTLLGAYRYFSPCLMGVRLGPRLMDLHNGTLFDDLFDRRNAPGNARHRETIHCFMRGLLVIADDIRGGRIPREVKIHGMLLYFNARNASALGFTVDSIGVVDRIVVAVGYVHMAIRSSVKDGRLTLPHFHEFKRASITGETLLAHAADIGRVVSGLDAHARAPAPTAGEGARPAASGR